MERDLARVLEAALDGVLVLDVHGHVELVNSEASRILETSASTARGTPVELIVGAEHAIAKLARSVLDSGRTAIESEHRIDRRYESPLVIDVAASPLFDEDDGSVNGVVLALRDRTIQHALEEVVNQRERLSAFGRIAAGIAHEVKNPLGGIRGAAEILASRAADGKTLDAAELIVSEVDRITNLVDDLMVFARGDELRIAPLNIHRVIDGVLDLLAMDPISHGVEVARAYDPSIPDVLGDRDRLNQVLLNLVRNGLQALEAAGREDGRLQIATRVVFDQRLADPTGERVPTLQVEISDNGPGMTPEVLAQVATPFFTTRAAGTGLGLAVSRHWVSRHGGSLRFESEPGSGTTARVALPLRLPS